LGFLDKARKLAEEHADKVGDAIDKVADVVDDKTGGKYADQIDKGANAAKGFVGDDRGDGEGDTAPPAPPAAP
jgi:antitoxin protein of toxin-antitoxin system